MNYRRLYQFIFARHGRRKWVRISLEEAATKFVKKYSNFDVYTTVQRYRTRVPDDAEEQWCPLFFDFDVPKEQSPEAFEEVRQDVLKLVNFFGQLGVPKYLIRIWFSGKRGFHVVVEPEIFGIEPHQELTYIIKELAFNLIEILSLKHLDTKIYTIKRSWRIPNSIHASTNLFKTELYKEELETNSIEAIRERAKKPRERLYDAIDYESITPDLKDFWMQYYTEYDSLKELEKLKPKKTISIPKGEYPICVKDLLSKSIKTQGTRNRAMMVLAGFFKDGGYSLEETLQVLVNFSKKIPNALSQSTEREREDNCKAVVRVVFSGDTYHFTCAYIRSLGTTENPVSCDYDICKYVKAEDQEPIEPIDVTLIESSKSSFVGLPMKIKCMVSGKDTTPYQIPRHLKIECQPDMASKKTNICDICRMKSKDGVAILRLPANDPLLLDMVGISKKYLDAVVKQIAKIPHKCQRFKVEVIDYGNLVDMQLIPRIKFSAETITKKTEYAVRRGLYVGHDVETSEEYEFIAYSYPDPKTQYSLLLITDKKKLEMSDVELKHDNKTILKELSIFQLGKDETIVSKLDDKWTDLEANVTRIYGRKLFSIALDLVFHSPIAFTFNRELVTKGWLELLAIGDSGQGKTQCVQKMIEHYQAGTLVSGETAKRTGLIYSLQQTGTRWFLQWGVIPLNDMRLVVIDEFHELDEEDIKNMTSLRDGVARVDAVITARTPSRTRLIYLCNPIGDPLLRWDFRVNAIQKLFKNQEDLRRIDFAIALTSGEVDVIELTGKLPDIPHKYTSQLCNMLIRWVWSLQPSHINITEEATSYILESVKTISDLFTSTIQLTEIGDLRKKIAKLSVATACLVFSTKDGETLEVNLQHAEFAVNFLKRIYKRMDYAEYTTMIKGNILDRETLNLAKNELKDFFSDKDVSDLKILITFLLQHKTFFKSELEMVVGDRKISRALIKLFYKHHLVNLGSKNRISKSGSFIVLLKEIEIELKVEDIQSEDIPF